MFWSSWFSTGFKKPPVKNYTNIHGKSVGGCVVFCLRKTSTSTMNSDNNTLNGSFWQSFNYQVIKRGTEISYLRKIPCLYLPPPQHNTCFCWSFFFFTSFSISTHLILLFSLFHKQERKKKWVWIWGKLLLVSSPLPCSWCSDRCFIEITLILFRYVLCGHFFKKILL